MKRILASNRCTGTYCSGASSQSPRAMEFWSMPILAAARCPARASLIFSVPSRNPRILVFCRVPLCNMLSPTCSFPDRRLPVTTVPIPFTLKLRSMRNRGLWFCWSASSDFVSRKVFCRNSIRVSRPSPVKLDTGKIGAFFKQVDDNSSVISPETSFICCALHLSVLVKAITPLEMPNRSRIDRCSLVCGMIPSSAAITSRA